jgi:hypothetical protein
MAGVSRLSIHADKLPGLARILPSARLSAKHFGNGDISPLARRRFHRERCRKGCHAVAGGYKRNFISGNYGQKRRNSSSGRLPFCRNI